MNYQRVYDAFISDRRTKEPNEHFEVHHILPRSCGGGDTPSNLIRLSYADHLFAHQLLARIYNNTEHAYYMWGAVAVLASNAFGGKSNHKRGYRNIAMPRLRKMYASAKHGLAASLADGSHPFSDPGVYTFENEDGRQFIGTRHELLTEHGVPTSSTRRVLSGKTRKTRSGWMAPKVREDTAERMAFHDHTVRFNGKKAVLINMGGAQFNYSPAQLKEHTGLPWDAVEAVFEGRGAEHGWIRL